MSASVAADSEIAQTSRTAARARPASLARRPRLVIALAAFSALSALGGGAELVVWRHGNRYVPIELLGHSGFETFLVPGLLLGLVVGGTSLACAVLAWRRSRWTSDATILAGGTLAVWILAEAAMMREASGLHVVYGALGLALLGLGVRAAWRTGEPRHRWVIGVTAAEALGFLAPAMAGLAVALTGARSPWPTLAVVAAGFVEGLVLGAGQAAVFPLPVRRARYALLTSLGAGVVWASVMATMAIAGSAAVPRGMAIVAFVIAGLVGLASIGTAQWIELAHHTPCAARWIAWTALAWVVALPASFAPGLFVDEATPVAAHVVLWGCGGIVMAYVMAQLTWQGVRRLPAVRIGAGAG